MKVVIVGGGKVGYYLTKTLLEHGHEPRLIEADREHCQHLANELDVPVIYGDGTTLDVLEAAGIEEADAIIGVSGRDENNLIACQLAKQRYHTPRTVARVNNPKNAQVMKQLGVDIPISTTDNIARLLEREVDTTAIKQLMAINRGEASLSEILLPTPYKLDGIALTELNLPQEFVVATIVRNGELIIPRGLTTLQAGDKIMVISSNKVLHQIPKLLQLE